MEETRENAAENAVFTLTEFCVDSRFIVCIIQDSHRLGGQPTGRINVRPDVTEGFNPLITKI